MVLIVAAVEVIVDAESIDESVLPWFVDCDWVETLSELVVKEVLANGLVDDTWLLVAVIADETLLVFDNTVGPPFWRLFKRIETSAKVVAFSVSN